MGKHFLHNIFQGRPKIHHFPRKYIADIQVSEEDVSESFSTQAATENFLLEKPFLNSKRLKSFNFS